MSITLKVYNDLLRNFLFGYSDVLTCEKRNVRISMRVNSMLLFWIKEWAKKVVLFSTSFQQNTRL